MHVRIMPCRLPLEQGQWPLLMQQAIEADGHTVSIDRAVSKTADVHVVWGLKRRWGKQALAEKRPTIIVEYAYLGDRGHWKSMGWNGLNGLADFVNRDVPDDRWRKYWADRLRPWRDDGQYALVIGQVPGDASLYGKSPYHWASEAIQAARKRFGKVMFRPHPKDPHQRRLRGADYHTGPLSEALEQAKVVITYTSNTAVDAVMAGVPVIAIHPGSMAREVSAHYIDGELYTGDRHEWGRKLAYTQWLPEEIAEGAAWRHLARKL